MQEKVNINVKLYIAVSTFYQAQATIVIGFIKVVYFDKLIKSAERIIKREETSY